MDGWMVAFFVPTLAFVTIVAPIWIFMHYRSKQRSQSELSDAERAQLDELAGTALHMLERIETLEAILDKDTPGWRGRHEDELSSSRSGLRGVANE
ncbi:MAG: envelope stress response membrane protein PspB [Pseudomonadota bacterium]